MSEKGVGGRESAYRKNNLAFLEPQQDSSHTKSWIQDDCIGSVKRCETLDSRRAHRSGLREGGGERARKRWIEKESEE